MTLLSNARHKTFGRNRFSFNNEFRYIGLAKKCERIGRDESVLTKHNFDKHPFLEAPAFESVIIIYAFAKAPKQLKTNEYIGVRPEEIGSYFTRQFRK
jgi:DNA polymerase-3 subunit alpha/error-prone DNA polymerase